MDRVRLLRAWYVLRERLGFPRRLSQAEHDHASDTVLLAGSPWTIWPVTVGTGTTSFWVTNTTWPIRVEEEDVD